MRVMRDELRLMRYGVITKMVIDMIRYAMLLITRYTRARAREIIDIFAFFIRCSFSTPPDAFTSSPRCFITRHLLSLPRCRAAAMMPQRFRVDTHVYAAAAALPCC